jgi:fructokinase
MARPYALVLGEALMDLLETHVDGELLYRPTVGGAPLNVAVGLARLGTTVEFAGSLGEDVLGRRVRALLVDAGVGDANLRTVAGPTTIALTSFIGHEPDFHFYGEPPSYGQFGPADLDLARVADAAAVYCGSIALLCAPVLAAARAAWAVPGPLRALDPNIRPRLLGDPATHRAVIEEFATTADLVKLSAPDATALYGASAEEVARRLRAVGARAVVVTLGSAGALVAADDTWERVESPPVRAVDATGAGDAMMAGLIHALLTRGVPDTAPAWRAVVGFATAVAGLVCEARGGATAMPAYDQVNARFPELAPST